MTTSSGPPLLEARRLVKHFDLRRPWFGRDRVRAVDDVSFRIEAGRTLALVGESGCGKSTTARLVLQLLRPDRGEVLLDGKVVAGADPAFRRSVQMVFQDPYASLTPHFRIRTTLREPLATHRIGNRGDRDARVDAAAAAVGLQADILSRYPHELSGGQRQRIAIARALAVDPRIIVCDEPVSALDVSIRAQIVNLLLDLQEQRHLAYLFISHDLDLVAHVSDEVAVMYLGTLVERAPTERFFAGPLHPYSQVLLASSPVPDPTRRSRATSLAVEPFMGAASLEVEPSIRSVPSTGCRFRTRCPSAIARCAAEEPLLRPVHEDHDCACHLVA